jgi:hypothetical protein
MNALYMYMCLAEDIETQKKGCVFIVFHPSPGTQVCASAEERGFVQRLMSSIPIRVSAIHVCLHDDAISKIIKSVFLVAIGPEGRARTRIHTGMSQSIATSFGSISTVHPTYVTLLLFVLKGSRTECQYALQSFGLPAQDLPVNTNSGKLKIKAHQKWIELRLRREEAAKSETEFHGIECPDLKDLLLGRGRPIMRHPGNVLLRNLIEARYQEYDDAQTRTEKTEVARSIVRQLRQSSCRFLKEGPNGSWVEVSSEVARQKVSVGFRDLRKNREESMDHQKNISSPVGTKRNLNSGTSVFLGLDGNVKRQKCNGVFGAMA